MTNLQLQAVKKAVAKGLKNGLGVDGIVSLVMTYEELLSDDDVSSDERFAVERPEPPPLIINAYDQGTVARKLSATTSMSVESVGSGKSLDDMFSELQSKAAETPTISFVITGYKQPVSYNIEPYKNESSRICGINFSVVGDRSVVASRTSYAEGTEFDIDKDIDDFTVSQKQMYKARSQPVVAHVARPISFSEALSNIERVGENAGSVS